MGTRRGGIRISHTRSTTQLGEVCVIFKDDDAIDDESIYVAHGIETSQVAVGPTVVEAYASLLASLVVLFDHHYRDPNTVLYRRAPLDVVERYTRASRLRDEDQEEAIGKALARTTGVRSWRAHGWKVVLPVHEQEPALPEEIEVSKEELLDDTGSEYFIKLLAARRSA